MKTSEPTFPYEVQKFGHGGIWWWCSSHSTLEEARRSMALFEEIGRARGWKDEFRIWDSRKGGKVE